MEKKNKMSTAEIGKVVEILKSLGDDVFDEDATEWAQDFDETSFWVWIGLHVDPSLIEITNFQTEDSVSGRVPICKVVVEGMENVAKLIIALEIDTDDVDNLLYNLYEELERRIPCNWADLSYDTAEVIDGISKKYDIPYKTVKC